MEEQNREANPETVTTLYVGLSQEELDMFQLVCQEDEQSYLRQAMMEKMIKSINALDTSDPRREELTRALNAYMGSAQP